jgi:hypothetical protein
MTDARYLLAVALGAAACCSGARDHGTTGPSIPQDSKMPSMTRWRSHTPTIAGATAGLTFDVVDGAPLGEGDIGSFHYVSQTSAPIQLDVWLGPDISLAWWRGRFGSRAPILGAESAISVCGRPGMRQEVSVPAEQATGVQPTADGSIGHIHSETPPEVHVAIAATTASGTPFVVAWRIPADRREALRADEAHFLSSIRC